MRIRVEIDELKRIEDFRELQEATAKVIVQERSTMVGMKAYARAENLNLGGGQGVEDGAGSGGLKRLEEDPPSLRVRDPFRVAGIGRVDGWRSSWCWRWYRYVEWT